jgi:hypothetical protein
MMSLDYTIRAGLLFLIIVTGVAGGVVAPGCRALRNSQGPLEHRFADFGSPHVFLGEIPWNTTIPFRVEFQNNSPEAVSIVAVQTSCGCTKVNTDDLTARELPPGAVLYVSGSVHSGQRVGLRRESIDVMLDSGLVRTVRLEYRVLSTYEVRPLGIEFDAVALPAPATNQAVRTALFTSHGASLSDVSSSVPWVQLGIRGLGERETEIAIALRPEFLRDGLNEGTVFVETDDLRRPVEVLSVRAQARAALRAVPGSLFLRDVDEQTVYLVGDQGDRVPVAQVVSPTCDTLVDFVVNPDGTVTVRWARAGAEPGATLTLVAGDGRTVDLRLYRME